ncbi:hypothetical protein [Streptomyces sp. NPDC096033]|uniref:hypothetical protein n=1 Tax=Streptomyces sp. NPDC096033 TaxID=3366071 RepID=UPI00381DDEE1
MTVINHGMLECGGSERWSGLDGEGLALRCTSRGRKSVSGTCHSRTCRRHGPNSGISLRTALSD